MNEETHVVDRYSPGSTLANGSLWYKADALPVLEQLFPGWVIIRCGTGQGPQFLSRNSAAFFGLSPDELTRKSYTDLLDLIHPDDREPYQRVGQRINDILKDTELAEVLRYRFTIMYRLRRRHEYISVCEERMLYLDDQAGQIRFTLFRDTSAERVFGRVQLDWYRTHHLGYQRIGSYVPAAAEQELTARELEIIQLIRDGFSSKEIADQLCISTNTVRNHRSNLFRKTQARNMVDLVHHARLANTVSS